MAWFPTARDEVEKVAIPLPFRVSVAMLVPSTLNTTEPVGLVVVLDSGMTWAVKVTFSVVVWGLTLVAKASVPALATETVKGTELEGLRLISPEYWATIE